MSITHHSIDTHCHIMSDQKGQADDLFRGFAPAIGAQIIPLQLDEFRGFAPAIGAPLGANNQVIAAPVPINPQPPGNNGAPVNQQPGNNVAQQQQFVAPANNNNGAPMGDGLSVPGAIIRYPAPPPIVPPPPPTPGDLGEARRELNRLYGLLVTEATQKQAAELELKMAEAKARDLADKARRMQDDFNQKLHDQKARYETELKTVEQRVLARNNVHVPDSKLASALTEIERLRAEVKQVQDRNAQEVARAVAAVSVVNEVDAKAAPSDVECKRKLKDLQDKLDAAEAKRKREVGALELKLTEAKTEFAAYISTVELKAAQTKASFARQLSDAEALYKLASQSDKEVRKADQQDAVEYQRQLRKEADEKAKDATDRARENERRNEKDFNTRAKATKDEIKEKVKELKERAMDVRDHQLGLIEIDTNLKIANFRNQADNKRVKEVGAARTKDVNTRWQKYSESVDKWADSTRFILFGDPGPLPPPPLPMQVPEADNIERDRFYYSVQAIALSIAREFDRSAEIPPISDVGQDYNGVLNVLEYAKKKVEQDPIVATQTLLENNNLDAESIGQVIKFFTDPSVSIIAPVMRVQKMIEQMESINIARREQLIFSRQSVILMQYLISWFTDTIKKHETHFAAYCDSLVDSIQQLQLLPDYDPNVGGLKNNSEELKSVVIDAPLLAKGLELFLDNQRKAHVFDLQDYTFREWTASATRMVKMMAEGGFEASVSVALDFNKATEDGFLKFNSAMNKSFIGFENSFKTAVVEFSNRFDTRVVNHFADAVAGIPVTEEKCLKRMNDVFNHVLAAFDEQKPVPPLVKKIEALSMEKAKMIEEVKESKNFSSRVFQLIGGADADMKEVKANIMPPPLNDDGKTASYDTLLVYIRHVFQKYAVTRKLLNESLLHVTDFKARKQLQEMMLTANSVEQVRALDKSKGGSLMPILEAGAASYHGGVSNVTLMTLKQTRMATMVPPADYEEYKSYGMLINFTKLVAGRLSRSVDTLLIPLIPNVETDSVTFKFIMQQLNEAKPDVTTNSSHHHFGVTTGNDRRQSNNPHTQGVEGVIAADVVEKVALLLPEQKDLMEKATRTLRELQVKMAMASLQSFNDAMQSDPMEDALVPFLVPTFLTELLSAYHMMKVAFSGCELHELLVCPPVRLVFAQLLAVNIAMSETFLNSNESYDKDRYLQLQAQQEAITTTIRRQVKRLGAYSWS